ncbi:MAG: GreA/GreB family elongation factor [Erysipelotrichaceae bacterium]|jgi:transcription elongation factor GreA|nr:GreA/GreB family elongation factor [Erysipelotrichaceae bacterium]
MITKTQAPQEAKIDSVFLSLRPVKEKMAADLKKELKPLLMKMDDLTQNGLFLTHEYSKTLQNEYRNIIDVQIPTTKEELKAARENGDLSENADYTFAREKLGRLEGRVLDIDAIFKDHVAKDIASERKQIADEVLKLLDKYQPHFKSKGKHNEFAACQAEVSDFIAPAACVTSRVKILLKGVKVDYMLVTSVETDTINGKISASSSLGKALLGKKVGEKTTYKNPKGEDITITLLEIN